MHLWKDSPQLYETWFGWEWVLQAEGTQDNEQGDEVGICKSLNKNDENMRKFYSNVNGKKTVYVFRGYNYISKNT